MGNTRIEWAEKTWNPITGCTKISPGCANCYAERMSKRLAGRYGYDRDDPFTVTLHLDRLNEPLKWRKPQIVFVCSMGDLFHEDVDEGFLCTVFDTMISAEQHTFLILTKRPERMKSFIDRCVHGIPKNIWLGVTVETQQRADERIPVLLQTPAVKRFVSVEPMLGPIDIDVAMYGVEGYGNNAFGYTDGFGYEALLHWIICGGETGPGARPMHPDWARSLRDQCVSAGVPFFFKQQGEWATFYDRDHDDPQWRHIPKDGPRVKCLNIEGGSGFHGDRVVYLKRVGKRASGRLLDGREWNERPEMPQ